MSNIFSLSVSEIAEKIRNSDLNSVDLCKSYIEQINKFEKDVKAWAHFDKKLLLEKAEEADEHRRSFAMLIALNLQTSFLTPPMAMSAYYLKGVQSRNVELMQIFTGIMPFLAIVILAMVLMYIFPGIALWLPDVLFAE